MERRITRSIARKVVHENRPVVHRLLLAVGNGQSLVAVHCSSAATELPPGVHSVQVHREQTNIPYQSD